MQTLDQLNKGDEAIVKKIGAIEDLKQRLNSFGVYRGVQIKVKEYAIKKKVIEIEINRTFLAVRLEEAQKIEVEKV